ncbi:MULTISPECIES: type IV pilin-like G/H family protein [unclassified Microcoleus]|uniref:type IV pilin-like G/H family protein n=1 Tax=unclassified Microcoleus TaxID=2642155 RepID=UPI0025D518DD|nr:MULTISPECIES: type IV pilin-like G/H family protein [unclassified Microcoleus]
MTKNQESIVDKGAYGGCRFLCRFLFLIICVGVANMIILPIFLGVTTKNKQSEAKRIVSIMNKNQQSYYAEKSVFSPSVDALAIGIKTETTNYKYSVRATKKAAFSYGVSKQPELKSSVGGVFVVPAKEVVPNAAKDEIKTISILCKADNRSTFKPAEPTYENGKIACGEGTTEVTK